MKPLTRTFFGSRNLSLFVQVSALLIAMGIPVYAQQVQPNTPQSQWDDLAAPKPMQAQQPGFDVSPTVQASWWKQVKLDLAPEYFYWEEDYNGKKLLDESGFRIGLEAAYNPSAEKGWIWASRIKINFGSVDYNGSLQNLITGATTPFKSTTDYYGVLGEAGYGYRFDLNQNYFFDVLGRLTLDFWVRRLGGGQYGYDEYWFPISIKAGVELSPKDVGWIGAVGLKVPVYTYQSSEHHVFGLDITSNDRPGPMVSPYAEAGYKFTEHFWLTAFFDSYWFKQSAVNNYFFQPESKSYEVGARLGWTF